MRSSRIWSGASRSGPAAGVLFGALAIALAASGASDWSVFSPPEGRFRIEFPSAPAFESDEHLTPVGSVREARYSLRVDDAELAVVTHDIPAVAAALMSEATILEQARDGVIEDEAGTPLTARELTVQGAPAREFTYRYPGEPVRLERVLTVLVGSRIYLLTGTGVDPAAHPAVTRFFTSFRFFRDDEEEAE